MLLLLLLRLRRLRRRKSANETSARKATVDATAMPDLNPVVWTVGTGRAAVEEEVDEAAAADIAALVDEGVGEHFPNAG